MIDLILIFDSRSGILLKEKIIQPLNGEPDLLAGFFHAINICLNEFFPGELSQGTKLELKNKIIRVTLVPRTTANLIVMADKSDKKILKEFSFEIIELFSYFRYRFLDFDGCVDIFNIFDKYMDKIIERANPPLDLDRYSKEAIHAEGTF